MKHTIQNLMIFLSILIVSLVGLVFANSRFIWKHDQRLHDAMWSSEVGSAEALVDLHDRLSQKVEFYLKKIDQSMLLDGMVVSRDITSEALDICDSLLFSAIYYVSLMKLQHYERAEKVWSAIESSAYDGEWYRHPRCQNKATSRDMMLGVLLALNQRMGKGKAHIHDTLEHIKKNNGFFSHGTLDVSFLSPGVGEYFRLMAEAYEINYQDIPSINFSFSTSEFSALSSDRGYRAHLIALQIWLELEMGLSGDYKEQWPPRSFFAVLSPLSKLFNLDYSPEKVRLSWIASRLYQLDPENVFFKYLRLKTARALSGIAIKSLGNEILNMKSFPSPRLPADCDRKADYLWQRGSDEYVSSRDACGKIYNGVDFVWMGALLLEELKGLRDKNPPTQKQLLGH